MFSTVLLECTSRLCHIKIPTTQCLWTQIKIPPFLLNSLIHLSTHYINILPQIRDKRATDPSAVLTGVSSVHHPEREKENETEEEDEAGILKYMVTLHESFICQQLFS